MFWVPKKKFLAECYQNTCSLLWVSVQGPLRVVRVSVGRLFFSWSQSSQENTRGVLSMRPQAQLTDTVRMELCSQDLKRAADHRVLELQGPVITISSDFGQQVCSKICVGCYLSVVYVVIFSDQESGGTFDWVTASGLVVSVHSFSQLHTNYIVFSLLETCRRSRR